MATYYRHRRGLLVLPMHNRDMKMGTPHAILKRANISQREFIELLLKLGTSKKLRPKVFREK